MSLWVKTSKSQIEQNNPASPSKADVLSPAARPGHATAPRPSRSTPVAVCWGELTVPASARRAGASCSRFGKPAM
jgi:hypothetical protein